MVCPMYITEIAPAKQRGLLVSVSQLNIVVGILLAYFSNALIAHWLGAENPSRLALDVWGDGLAVARLFRRGARHSGKPALVRQTKPLWPKPLPSSRASGTKTRRGSAARSSNRFPRKPAGVSERLFQRKYLRPLLLAVMVAVFNQLDGINAVIYYTADIFRMAGADQGGALFESVIVGFTNLVMTHRRHGADRPRGPQGAFAVGFGDVRVFPRCWRSGFLPPMPRDGSSSPR